MKNITLITALFVFSATASKAQTDVNTTVVQDVFNAYSTSSRVGTGVDFHTPPATIGSPYLFDKWVKGTVVNSHDTVVDNPSFRFNYNKMNGALLVTQDQKTYIELDRGSYKAFTLNDALGIAYSFEKVPSVNPNTLVQIISKGDKYGIYKLVKTRFKKADYHTDGLTESGDQENQYLDESEFYMINLKAKTPAVKISFKKKSLKEAFSADAAQVDTYFAEHKEDDINEVFVRGLGDALNGK